ncbi:alpha/beta fold hydrolase [Compostimonas suwonensis]|uniref:Pimeloyl-ACP methyl ester carboxylesterase n=1 Tax=Compostimonas suwonensis TaxID=1048394 RepID=A0A2M9BYQ7_9MICO|nr:alpha/beta hydrolase [Compostimonas suwonensis]PJJ63212.1 pimeloyl-ACP methyl ester carboxylesterase [Compostimonas suwonensis]
MTVPSPYHELLDRIPVRAESLSLDGGLTRYWVYGDADARTTIVMVHGFRGDHHGLEPVVAQLGSDYRIISPDLPGFGESTPLPGRTHDIDTYARWLDDFVQALGLNRARTIVLGHSFGSIVVSAALAAPSGTIAGSVRSVILVNPIAAPALAGPRGILTKLAVFYYRLGAALPERLGFGLLRNRAIVRVMSVTMAKTGDRGLRRWIHDQHDRYFSAFANRRVVLEAFEASVSNDVSEYAERITLPTQLIAADRDDITPVAAERRLATLFPDARLHVIEGVGHLIHYEAPAEAAGVIEGFIAEVRA